MRSSCGICGFVVIAYLYKFAHAPGIERTPSWLAEPSAWIRDIDPVMNRLPDLGRHLHEILPMLLTHSEGNALYMRVIVLSSDEENLLALELLLADHGPCPKAVGGELEPGAFRPVRDLLARRLPVHQDARGVQHVHVSDDRAQTDLRTDLEINPLLDDRSIADHPGPDRRKHLFPGDSDQGPIGPTQFFDRIVGLFLPAAKPGLFFLLLLLFFPSRLEAIVHGLPVGIDASLGILPECIFDDVVDDHAGVSLPAPGLGNLVDVLELEVLRTKENLLDLRDREILHGTMSGDIEHLVDAFFHHDRQTAALFRFAFRQVNSPAFCELELPELLLLPIALHQVDDPSRAPCVAAEIRSRSLDPRSRRFSG